MAELNYAKKRLQPIIEKFGIDPKTDKVFQSIITLFDGQTDYQMWGIKVVYGKSLTLEMLIGIKEWATANPTEISNLSLKNLVSYKTVTDMAKLRAEMQSLDAFHFVKNILNTFNTDQRKRLKSAFIEPVESTPYNCLTNKNFKKFYELALPFTKLPEHRKQKFVILMSAVNSVEDIMKHMKSALETTYEWNREDFLLYFQNNCPNSEICYDKDGIVIVRLDNFATAKKLCGGGRTGWCLTRESRYFNQYTHDNNNASQFALFDFNRQEKNDLAHIGFTVNPERGITHAHSTRNNSMMGSIMVDGERWDINKVLSHHKIPKNAYIRLRPLRNYKWDKKNFIQKLNTYRDSVKIIELPDGRLIIPITNNDVRNFILNHTLIGNQQSSGSDSQTFVVMDFSVDVNDEKSLLYVKFSKDMYGSLSFYSLYEPYGTSTNDRAKYAKHNLSDDLFVKSHKLDPSILLHKCIDEENYDAAVKLLAEDKSVDPNKIFLNNLPIIKAILKGHLDLFYALTKHPKFDWNAVEGFGEPYLQFLMIYMGANVKPKNKDPKPFIEMGMHFLESEKYDNTSLDGLRCNILHGACEAGEICLPFLEYALRENKVDINAKNEFGFTPLDVALENDNIPAADMILSYPNVEITAQTRELAQKKGFTLPNDGKVETAGAKPDEYEDLFTSIFSSL